MPSFTHSQLHFFNASDGAGSPVTKTEFGDSQVTLDKDEKRVLFSKIPESAVPRGSVKSNSAKKFPFRVFNKRKNSLLHVNFPKPKKSELRLYLSSREGFKPSIGDYWFIFRENTSNDIVVGYVDEKDGSCLKIKVWVHSVNQFPLPHQLTLGMRNISKIFMTQRQNLHRQWFPTRLKETSI